MVLITTAGEEEFQAFRATQPAPEPMAGAGGLKPSPYQGPSPSGQYNEPYFTQEPPAASPYQGPSESGTYEEPYFQGAGALPEAAVPDFLAEQRAAQPRGFSLLPFSSMDQGGVSTGPEENINAGQDVGGGGWLDRLKSAAGDVATNVLDPGGGYAALQRYYGGEGEFTAPSFSNIKTNREQADWRAALQSLIPPSVLDKLPDSPYFPARQVVEGLSSPAAIATVPIGGTFAGGVARCWSPDLRTA